MQGLKQLIRRRSNLRDSILASISTAQPDNFHHSLPSHHLARLTPKRFLDWPQFSNKEAIAKERARINDEMKRGYVADLAEIKQHGGKVSVANKVIIPAMMAMKFPDIQVSFPDGKIMKLPIRISDKAVDSDESSVPKASLVCLSFRGYSEKMIDSWSVPFAKTFSNSKDTHLYKVSFIDSWFLCLPPIKNFLMWTIKKPNHNENKDTLEAKMVYSFGDHYYFRKELNLENLLTGYVFLLDNFGRIRWQGFGMATEDEVSSLLSCTSLLLDS
ncbi:unnamed protein product [Lathyrus sativus]|nr:unnamed protein product [Lathyrus sativus]